MCDGTYDYPLKNGCKTRLNAIVIICGNKSPEFLYPNCWKYMLTRFNVLNVD